MNNLQKTTRETVEEEGENLADVKSFAKLYVWIFVLLAIGLFFLKPTLLIWTIFVIGGLVCWLLLAVLNDLVILRLAVSQVARLINLYGQEFSERRGRDG